MRTLNIALAANMAISITACGAAEEPTRKEAVGHHVFAAIEAEGALVDIDGDTGQLLAKIDLSETANGATTSFDVHNAQGAPDAKTVWVTAMPGGMEGMEGMQEQLIGVDVATRTVIARIVLGADLHAAHVVIAQHTAYVTANEADAVVVVDLEAGTVERTIALPPGSAPHGARLTPDGTQLVVAGMGTGSIELVDLTSDEVTSFALPGRGVQAAVLPDGTAAFVSVFDTSQVAKLDLSTRELSLYDMPAGSVGPVQMYPTPDSQHVWVVDQGLLDGRPAGNLVHRVTTSGTFDLSASVAPAPHGIVVGRDGARLWVTTLVDGTVDMLDARTGARLSSVPIGEEPNGITCLHGSAAMP